jgi:NAD(P)-dependent dehydrogenase (short-subunit alcohol dehydrogenase family)
MRKLLTHNCVLRIGNTGLGLEAVRALAASPIAYEIIVGCRTPSKGEAAIETVKGELPSTASTFSVQQVDLCSDDSIEAAVQAISARHGHLDVLINNSGAAFDGEVAAGRMTIRQMLNASWDVNVSGTHVLTTLCCPLLLKSENPRLLFITSGTSTLTETESTEENPMTKRLNSSPPAGWPKPHVGPLTAYRSVKTGLNMVMREWTRILRNDGVKVWAVSPGFLATGLGGQGAEKLKEVSSRYGIPGRGVQQRRQVSC